MTLRMSILPWHGTKFILWGTIMMLQQSKVHAYTLMLWRCHGSITETMPLNPIRKLVKINGKSPFLLSEQIQFVFFMFSVFLLLPCVRLLRSMVAPSYTTDILLFVNVQNVLLLLLSVSECVFSHKNWSFVSLSFSDTPSLSLSLFHL